MSPIGFVRSPFSERAQAPRQPGAGQGARGRIELLAGRGFEDALEGLGNWEYVWVLYVFHRNVEQGRGWRPKVLPPRATAKVGLFATRSPHRPNPIGMSAVRIERVEDLVVHVAGLDLLDATPVLDLKPYVPYADAHPRAGSGWLEVRDPRASWRVTVVDPATRQLDWLKERGVDLRPRIEAVLALGPQPHAYRRIRARGEGFELAIKDWRVDFTVKGESMPSVTQSVMPSVIVVRAVRTGYRRRDAGDLAGIELHQSFVETFAQTTRLDET
jgi:tRNA-Thr(GGU) m(6)t(6)A37 methyltransferase TsaA